MHAIHRAARAATRSEITSAAIAALRRLRIEHAAPEDHHEAEHDGPTTILAELDQALADPGFRKQLARALGADSG